MLRRLAISAALIFTIGVGYAVAATVSDPTTGTNVSCATATATTPDHTVGVDGTDVDTIAGASTTASHCETATYTIPTTTQTDTATVTQTVTAPPAPPVTSSTTSSTTTTPTSSTTTTSTTSAPPPPPAGTNCAGKPGSKTPDFAALDACGFPSPNTTGVPAGTTLKNSGSMTVSTAGAVVSGMNVTGSITVTAPNVTIQNTMVTCSGCATAIHNASSGLMTVKNSTIQGGNSCAGEITNAAIGYNHVNVSGVLIQNTTEGVNGGDDNVSGSYIITNTHCAGDHTEPVDDADGNSTGELIQHNTLLNPNDETAAIIAGGSWGVLKGTVITGNLVAGGDYPIYCCETSPWGVTAAPTGTSVTNNRYSRLYFTDGGSFGNTADLNTSHTPFTGNVWDDTLAPVNAGS